MPRFLLVLVLMPCLNSYADESVSEEYSTSATRFDVLLGPSFGDRSITITDKDSSQEAAKFTTDGIELVPREPTNKSSRLSVLIKAARFMARSAT